MVKKVNNDKHVDHDTNVKNIGCYSNFEDEAIKKEKNIEITRETDHWRKTNNTSSLENI